MNFSAALRISTPGSSPRFAQDLKAVADAEHQPAIGRELAHRIHDRRAAGNRAAAQIVAVGKPARHDDEIGARRQRGVGMPHHRRLAAGNEFERARHVALAIDAGKNEDGGFHRSHLTRPTSPVATCILNRGSTVNTFSFRARTVDILLMEDQDIAERGVGGDHDHRARITVVGAIAHPAARQTGESSPRTIHIANPAGRSPADWCGRNQDRSGSSGKRRIWSLRPAGSAASAGR